MINYHLLRLEILRRGQILCMYLLHYILIVYVFAVQAWIWILFVVLFFLRKKLRFSLWCLLSFKLSYLVIPTLNYSWSQNIDASFSDTTHSQGLKLSCKKKKIAICFQSRILSNQLFKVSSARTKIEALKALTIFCNCVV